MQLCMYCCELGAVSMVDSSYSLSSSVCMIARLRFRQPGRRTHSRASRVLHRHRSHILILYPTNFTPPISHVCWLADIRNVIRSLIKDSRFDPAGTTMDTWFSRTMLDSPAKKNSFHQEQPWASEITNRGYTQKNNHQKITSWKVTRIDAKTSEL